MPKRGLQSQKALGVRKLVPDLCTRLWPHGKPGSTDPRDLCQSALPAYRTSGLTWRPVPAPHGVDTQECAGTIYINDVSWPQPRDR